jgi:hypothetical protein
MRKLIPFLFVSLLALPLNADEPVRVTPAQVLELMSRVPEKAHPSRAGRYDQAGDAREIAAAIAGVAPERDTAALMTVYAAYESSNQKCVVGDGGRSWGTWQLQYVPREVACDPARAASVWLAMARDASTRCPQSPPDDRLSVLTGGSCSRGVLVARTRARIARELAAQP